MPESLLDSRSPFDRYKALLGSWLRGNAASVRALSHDILAQYTSEFGFLAGWRVELLRDGTIYVLHVLVDAQFPYSSIRVSLETDDKYLHWPHVEAAGVLCLPHMPPASAALSEAIGGSLVAAIELIDLCQDPAHVASEMRREFVSYWNRSVDKSATPVRSLLNASNHEARHIYVWHGKSYDVVGESDDDVRSWLRNMGKESDALIGLGIFAFLDQAPTPSYLDRTAQLCTLLNEHCPGALLLLSKIPLDQRVTIILAATSPSGTGLMALKLDKPNLNGFRQGGNMPAKVRISVWKSRSRLMRRKVDRFDTAWIHGRGLNKDLPTLAEATVLLIGCGSLGSQVAHRLAQAGVGRLYAVDPERFEAANAGRHALGIASAGNGKALELAKRLRMDYPHIRMSHGWNDSWQAVYAREPELFTNAHLIIACTGEWPSDGQLGDLHTRAVITAPVVYGWLDEAGSAAHALGLEAGLPALSCVLSPAGELRRPESSWEDGGLLQTEPACGSLFQPYGPLDVARAEALVSRLCLDILTSSITLPVHRVYAGPTAAIAANGGQWSEEHLRHRPKGYDGPFEYVRTLEACSKCPACTAAA